MIAWMHNNLPTTTAGALWPDLSEPEFSMNMETYALNGATDFATFADAICISTREAFQAKLATWKTQIEGLGVEWIPGINVLNNGNNNEIFDLSFWEDTIAPIITANTPAGGRFLIDMETVYKSANYTLAEWAAARSTWWSICDVLNDTDKDLLIHHPVIVMGSTAYPDRQTISTEMVTVLACRCKQATIIDPTRSYVANADAADDRYNQMIAAVGGASRMIRQALVSPSADRQTTGVGDYYTVDEVYPLNWDSSTILFTGGEFWTATADEWKTNLGL